MSFYNSCFILLTWILIFLCCKHTICMSGCMEMLTLRTSSLMHLYKTHYKECAIATEKHSAGLHNMPIGL